MMLHNTHAKELLTVLVIMIVVPRKMLPRLANIWNIKRTPDSAFSYVVYAFVSWVYPSEVFISKNIEISSKGKK